MVSPGFALANFDFAQNVISTASWFPRRRLTRSVARPASRALSVRLARVTLADGRGGFTGRLHLDRCRARTLRRAAGARARARGRAAVRIPAQQPARRATRSRA